MRKKPQGLVKGPYVMLRQEMKESLGWRALNNVDRKILDRLEIELMKHAGKNNGELICTYDNFAEYGIRRKSIAASIRRLIRAGFLRITRKPWKSVINGMPAMYALTYMPIGDRPPTDEWRNYRPNKRHTETRPHFHRGVLATTARSSEMAPTASGEMAPTASPKSRGETAPTFYNATHSLSLEETGKEVDEAVGTATPLVPEPPKKPWTKPVLTKITDPEMIVRIRREFGYEYV